MAEKGGDNRISILEYVHQFVIWKKFISLNIFFLLLFAVLISLVIPKTYVSTSTILPASDSGDLLGISSLLSDLPSIGGLGGMTSLSSEGTTLMAILNSRTMFDSVVNKFNLQKLYKTKTLVETRKKLAQNVNIFPTDEGTIKVEVKAKTKYFSFGEKDKESQLLCGEMSSYFVTLLDTMNKKLRLEKATNQRLFVEKRYNKNLADLEKAENMFNEFQNKYGVISIEEQTKATIEAIAELKALVMAKEVQVEVMKSYMATTHSDYKKNIQELNALENKLNQFLSPEDSQSPSEMEVFLPVKEIPDVGLLYARLFREVMIQQKIQEFLVPMYEQAKIQEAKDTPSLQIIDYAEVPDKKSSPKRAFIVLFAGAIGFFFMVFLVYATVNLRFLKENKPSTYNKLSSIWDDLSFRK